MAHCGGGIAGAAIAGELAADSGEIVVLLEADPSIPLIRREFSPRTFDLVPRRKYYSPRRIRRSRSIGYHPPRMRAVWNDDIREHHGGQHAIGLVRVPFAGYEFLDFVQDNVLCVIV